MNELWLASELAFLSIKTARDKSFIPTAESPSWIGGKRPRAQRGMWQLLRTPSPSIGISRQTFTLVVGHRLARGT
jgi:hypothetical protein